MKNLRKTISADQLSIYSEVIITQKREMNSAHLNHNCNYNRYLMIIFIIITVFIIIIRGLSYNHTFYQKVIKLLYFITGTDAALFYLLT